MKQVSKKLFIKEYNADIDKSLREIEHGKCIPHMEMVKMTKKILSQGRKKI